MELIINDVDETHSLLSCASVRNFFPPKHGFYITDLSLHSFGNESRKLNKYIEEGILIVKRFTGLEILKISALYNSYSGEVSFTNAGVIYYAKASSGILITDQKILIRIAKKNSVSCKSLIWVFDQYQKKILISVKGGGSK